MKTRNGFVSNSSSSSFIIAFDKQPKYSDDVWKAMFPTDEDRKTGVPSPYDWNADVDCGTASTLVWQQIEKQKPLTKTQMLKELDGGRKKERNPARRALEVNCGYDSKHASHLVRLMRMGYEIMTEGKVIVKRPDAEELLDVKNGKWTFERVMAYKDEMQAKLDAVYAEQKKLHAEGKKTVIPWGVDFAAINEMYHDLYERYNNQ